MSILRYLPVLLLATAFGAPLAAGAQTSASPTPAASAAPAPGPSAATHRRHHHVSFLSRVRALDLTPAQQQQIAALHKQQVAANQHADPATRKANNAKLRAAVMAILTPDQQAQLQSRMARTRTHANGPAPVASPAAQ